MKDLTHYFNSPKEEETASTALKSEPEDNSNNELVKDKEPTSKKRKLTLSKNKSKKNEIKPSKVERNSNKNAETQAEEVISENRAITQSIKRKLSEESKTPLKKTKTEKYLKLSLKKCDAKQNKDNMTINSIEQTNKCADTEDHETKSIKKDQLVKVKNKPGEEPNSNSKEIKTKNDIPKKPLEAIYVDSSNSCDEPIMQTKRSKNHLSRNIFLESDDESSVKKEVSPQSSANTTETSQSPTSPHNNLLNYFNKVDKEVALKKKAEKIKVEALVHFPPNKEHKSPRRSLDKRPLCSKQKKHKNKAQLDDSDTIEVICSEDIVDENSSLSVNEQTTAKVQPEVDTNKHNKKIVNVNKATTNNLASIFTSKRIDKPNSSLELSQNEGNKSSQLVEEKKVLEVKEKQENKTATNSTVKLSSATKLKKHKTKLKRENTDDIEIINTQVARDSTNLLSEVQPTKIEPKEAGTNKKETVNISESPPNNLASIFIPKKIDKPENSKSSQNAEIKTPPIIEEKMEVVTEKKETQSKKKKKSLGTKSTSKNKEKSGNKSMKINKINENTELLMIEDTNSSQAVQTVVAKIKKEEICSDKDFSKASNKSNNLNGFVKTFKIESCNNLKKGHSSEKAKGISFESPKMNALDPGKAKHKTPQKQCVNTGNNYKLDLITPKQKHVTLNGYFTPKNALSEKKCSSRKGQKSSSPWIMKVRLNSAINDLSGDDDDSKGSQDTNEQISTSQVTYEEISNSQEGPGNQDEATTKDDTDSTTIVADDDVDPVETRQKNMSKRKSLPRCAKKLKVSPTKEETIVKSPETPVIVVDDDEDSSDSSKKNMVKKKSLRSCAKKLKTTDTEDETTVESPKPPVKVWPFFQKRGASRQTKEAEAPIDEAKMRAKMLFLESGVPEVIKRKVEIVKNEAVLGTPAPFPTVSHVIQLEASSAVEETSFPLPRPRCASPAPSTPTWSPLLSPATSEDPEIPVFERPGNIKAFLQQLKEEEPKTEVKALFKTLKEYKNKAETDVWTDIYKPTKSADMVGNSDSIKKLKAWLETLKNRRKREGSVSSGDEFVNDDSDGESNTFNNMAIISGPCGCGKTSAIYAVANELDCKVLELNASCNRSGKRILAEFSESTQSHQVERSQPVSDFFNSQSKSKKRKKSKTTNESKSEKTSLILVEDADLLFADTDDGFMPALASLAATSKRPLILVTNQARNPHLDRFQNSRLLQLTFSRPKASKLGLWLRLVGLVEGVMMTAQQATSLVEWSGCDVRRSLLQLQLMVHSNNSEIKDAVSETQLWWQWPSQYQLQYELPTLLEPEEAVAQGETDKKIIIKQLQSVADTASHLAYLDVLSAHGRLSGCANDDPCPVSWRASCRDSTSLTECQESPRDQSGPHDMSRDLTTWLARTVTRDWHGSMRSGQNPHEARWLSVLRQGEQLFMPGISTTMHSHHQSVSCDYLPALRDLGRAEQIRLANYTRRANRFFNYLQGLGIHAGKSYRDFMCDAFS